MRKARGRSIRKRARPLGLPWPGASRAVEEGMDLDAYFARIAYSGPREPTLALLQDLHALHPAAIPFENLTPFAGGPVSLELAAIEAKLVQGGRGGYCFEQNLLFQEVLGRLGFEVSGLVARVVRGRAADAETARSHMLLRVELDGATWIADVGFGGLTTTAPLRLDTEAAQATPHGPYRVLRRERGEFLVQTQLNPGEWEALYRFDLSPAYLADYQVSNYYLSTSPDSLFRTRLMAARALPGVRYALGNRELTLYRSGQPREQRSLDSPAALMQALEDTFGLALASEPETQAALQRLF